MNQEKVDAGTQHSILSERHGIKKLFNPQIANETSMLEAISESFNMFQSLAPPVTIIHGPPGTGKTLMARKIGQMLKTF